MLKDICMKMSTITVEILVPHLNSTFLKEILNSGTSLIQQITDLKKILTKPAKECANIFNINFYLYDYHFYYYYKLLSA